jgi:hypothetical protein
VTTLAFTLLGSTLAFTLLGSLARARRAATASLGSLILGVLILSQVNTVGLQLLVLVSVRRQVFFAIPCPLSLVGNVLLDESDAFHPEFLKVQDVSFVLWETTIFIEQSLLLVVMRGRRQL